MRRRVVGLTLAITSLVVIAFTVPLLFLVRNQARERGQLAAERSAQTTAALVALVAAGNEALSLDSLSGALGDLPVGVGVVLPDGSLLGDVPEGGEVLSRVRLGSPAAGFGEGGWEVGIPVASRHGLLAVVAGAPFAELRRGLLPASAALIGLGLVIIAAASALAWRLAKDLVRPVDELAEVADRLGSGDLQARASEQGIPEIAAVGHALNQLSGRLKQMIAAERESLADLSHQLRTPLAGLKLQADRLDGNPEVADAVGQMEAAVNSLINEARTGRGVSAGCDLREVMVKRVTFWRVLAEEQGRALTASDSKQVLRVGVTSETMGSIADTLIGNVLAHTPPGVSFLVGWTRDGSEAVLTVEDDGPGFPRGLDPTARGVSGAGSTGLGLDIARRSAEAVGGRLLWGTSAERGGARIELRLPLI